MTQERNSLTAEQLASSSAMMSANSVTMTFLALVSLRTIHLRLVHTEKNPRRLRYESLVFNNFKLIDGKINFYVFEFHLLSINSPFLRYFH